MKTKFQVYSWVLAVTLSATILCSCTTTVIPKTVAITQPSFDGNDANGGYIGKNPGGGFIYTANARARYNSLIDAYGSAFKPPIARDHGVVSGPFQGQPTYILTAEAVSKFADMNRWKHEGRTPP